MKLSLRCSQSSIGTLAGPVGTEAPFHMASATTPHDGPTHTEQPRHIARPHRLALGGSDLLTRRVVRCVCITNRPRPEQHKMECARWVTLKNRASTAASCKSCSAALPVDTQTRPGPRRGCTGTPSGREERGPMAQLTADRDTQL